MLTEGDEREGGRVQETASSRSQLSTQTVFSILSHLTQWSRHILYSKPKLNGNMIHFNLNDPHLSSVYCI